MEEKRKHCSDCVHGLEPTNQFPCSDCIAEGNRMWFLPFDSKLQGEKP